MKPLFTLLISLFTGIVFGQDTTFFDIEGNQTRSLASCHHYEIIERDASDTNKVVLRAYYKSGQMKSLKNFNPYSKKKLNGKFQEWFENGQIRKDINFKDGIYDGNLLTYWDNGQLKRKDSYQDGKWLEGKCWNAEGKEVEYYGYELMAEFPGGERELSIYLYRSAKNTSRTIRKWEQGVVYVFFTVDKDGSVTKVKIKEGLSPFLNEEALRIVKSMPKWTPGYQDGEPAVVTYTLPVSFRTY